MAANDNSDPIPPATALLTAPQVAKVLGVPVTWVYAQSRAGTLPTVRLGRYYRYQSEAVARWIDERESRARHAEVA